MTGTLNDGTMQRRKIKDVKWSSATGIQTKDKNDYKFRTAGFKEIRL